MGKFFSIPGMNPSGGEGKMGGGRSDRPTPTREQLESRYGEYYKNRGEISTSAFAEVGDRMKIRGEEAMVRHVEKRANGVQELTVQKSSQTDSGTYSVKIEPDKNRKQQIGAIKRIHE